MVEPIADQVAIPPPRAKSSDGSTPSKRGARLFRAADSPDVEKSIASYWTEPSEHSSSRVRVLLLGLLTLNLAFFAVNILLWTMHTGEHASAEHTSRLNEVAIARAEARARISDMLQRFWRSTSADETVAMVRGGTAHRDLLADYFENADERLVIGVVDRDVTPDVIGGTLFYHVTGAFTNGAEFDFVVEERRPIHRDGEPTYLLDWKHAMGHNAASFDAFVDRRESEPAVFRVWAAVGDYYNYGFTEENSICLTLRSHAGTATCHAYARLDTPAGTHLFQQLARPSSGVVVNEVRLKLEIAFGDNGQATINRVFPAGWIDETL